MNAIPTVRLIAVDGDRYASTEVDRAALTRFPELAVAAIDALLAQLDASQQQAPATAHVKDLCSTCWPRPCEPGRLYCQRTTPPRQP